MKILASLAILGFIISTMFTKKALTSSSASPTNSAFHLIFIISLILLSIYTYTLLLNYSIKVNFNLALMTTFLILNYIFFLFMFKKPICHLSLVLFPLTCISVLSTLLFDLKEIQGEIDYNLVIHIVFSLLSYGFLGLAALQAMLLKYQGYKLRNVKNSVINDISVSYTHLTLPTKA